MSPLILENEQSAENGHHTFLGYGKDNCGNIQANGPVATSKEMRRQTQGLDRFELNQIVKGRIRQAQLERNHLNDNRSAPIINKILKLYSEVITGGFHSVVLMFVVCGALW